MKAHYNPWGIGCNLIRPHKQVPSHSRGPLQFNHLCAASCGHLFWSALIYALFGSRHNLMRLAIFKTCTRPTDQKLKQANLCVNEGYS